MTRPAKSPGERHRRYRPEDFDYLCLVCDPETILVLPVHLLYSKTNPAELVGHFEYKPVPSNNRKDSAAATARWAPYLNQFALLHPPPPKPPEPVAEPPAPPLTDEERALL